MPRTTTTISDSADAAAKGRKGAIAKAAKAAAIAAVEEAARKAATEAAGGAPAPEAPPPGAATAATVAQHAQAAATAAAVRLIPPACRVEIERLVPAWARGYLETADSDAIRSYGLREYLRENWGGERYKITVQDNDGGTLWTAADVFVAGRPRHYGQDLAPPNPIPATLAVPMAAPAPPHQAGPDPAVRDLAIAVAGLSRQTAAILEHLARSGPAPAQAADGAAAPDRPGLLSAIDEAVQIREALERLAPTPQAAPNPGDPEDGMSAFTRDVGREFIKRGMDEWFPKKPREQAPQAAPASSSRPTQPTQVRPPPAGGAGSRPPTAQAPGAGGNGGTPPTAERLP